MKAARIARLVKKVRRAVIFTDKSGRQWVGTERYAYLADESIRLTEENVLGVLDIDADKRDEIEVLAVEQSEPMARLLDISPQEGDMLLYPKMSVTWNGDLLTILRSEDGEETVMVPQAAIHPADGKSGLGFYLRGGRVAAFEDLFCSAVLAPISNEEQDKVIALIHQAIGETDDAAAQEIIREANERAEREHRRAEEAVCALVKARQAQAE